MDTDTTYGLKADQLINLLSMGADKELFCNETMHSDEEIKAFFKSLYYRKIPKESSIVDSILIYLRESKSFGKLIINYSLGDILTNPETTIDLLRAIKDYSKKIYQSTISEGENSIAVAIYYSAIASGLVCHGMKISEHTYNSLKDAFKNLMDQPWVFPEIRKLFSDAHEICLNQISHNG